MALRTRSARWFEVLVPAPKAGRAAELLADTGLVELEPGSAVERALDLSAIRNGLDEFAEIRERCGNAWPRPREVAPSDEGKALDEALVEVLQPLRDWEREAAPLIEEAAALEMRREELAPLARFLEALGDSPEPDFGRVVRTRPPLAAALFMLPAEAHVPMPADAVIRRRVDTAEHTWLLVLGRDTAVAEFGQGAGGHGSRRIALPEWLAGPPLQALRAVEERRESAARRLAEIDAALVELGERFGIAEALGRVRRLQWRLEHLEGAAVSDYLARLDGWTSDPSGRRLLGTLKAAGIPAVVGFPAPPADRVPPTLSDNPPWARPFELFVRLMGTPGGNEADPSRLLAVIGPLLFGYMFGDVGQGAVLLVAGLFLWRRWPALGMLIPGGLMAILFGVLFGSVFCLEDIIPALWVHPVTQPLPVLFVPIAGGAVLILFGLLLNGLAARWGGQGGTWWRIEAGLVTLYAGGMLAVWRLVPGLWTVAAGLLWYLGGCAWEHRHHGIAVVLGSMGEILERLLQLAVNTLSFIRVGAFALAHAGLSLAVVSLARSIEHPAGMLLVLIVGNLGVLFLEGLVVFVQTTRLILFEFFIRFLRAEGRPFQPSPPPFAH
ncbi:MAG: ATPase [Gammaproteobacteria bacterium]|jgi:V/A-type H+-transporting ATPase subunit I